MKKISRLLVAFLTLTLFTFSSNANAATKIIDRGTLQDTDDLLNRFPDLESELIAGGYTELASTQNSYFKFVLKDKELKKSTYESNDFIMTEISADEFNAARLKEENLNNGRLADYVGGTGGDKYLKLNLNSFRNSSLKYKFAITHSYTWINGSPAMSLTDVIGISVGNTMKINANSYTSQSQYAIMRPDPSSPTGVSPYSEVVSNTNIKHTNLGIATKYDVRSGVDNSGYIKAEAQFTQTGSALGLQTANIFGNYIHTKIGLNGSLSIGTTGKPSIGLTAVEKNYEFAIDVDYK